MGLTREEGALVRVAAALAAAGADAGAAVLVGALESAVLEADARRVEEVLLQSYLFLGFPTVLNAFGVWRDVSGLSAPSVERDDPKEWLSRGEAACRRVYAARYERLLENVRRLHPELERWMLTEGYGKVLGRSGLPLATRELCIVAQLAVADAPLQLEAHLWGAWNAGASRGAVGEALALAAEVGSPSANRRSAEVWRAVDGSLSSREEA